MKLNELKIGDKVYINYENSNYENTMCAGYLLDSVEFPQVRVQLCVGDCFVGIPPCVVIHRSNIVSKVVEKTITEEIPIERELPMDKVVMAFVPHRVYQTLEQKFMRLKIYKTEVDGQFCDGGEISLRFLNTINIEPNKKYKLTIEEIQ